MNLTEIIDGITGSHCAACKYGRALIALRDLRDEDGTNPTQPVSSGNAAPKRKLQKKTAKIVNGKAKECNACHKTLPLDDFPKNKSCTGGRAGTCKACSYARAKRRNADKAKAAASRKQVESEQSHPGIVRCQLCDYRALDKARLNSHMKTSHGMSAS